VANDAPVFETMTRFRTLGNIEPALLMELRRYWRGASSTTIRSAMMERRNRPRPYRMDGAEAALDLAAAAARQNMKTRWPDNEEETNV
jgi:hypothetical protein